MQPKLFETLQQLTVPSGKEFYAKCRYHDKHTEQHVACNLDGQPVMRDVPSIPERLAMSLSFHVYNWRNYFKTVGSNETIPLYEDYCTGQDIISYCIDQQGLWEGYETLLLLDLLNEDAAERGDVVLDFGSHIGWYTTIAAISGFRVAAIDASAENLAMVRKNALENRVADKVFTYRAWLQGGEPLLPMHEEQVQLIKCDVEGAERYVARMCRPLFAGRKVKYMLMEISPTFNDTYPDIVEMIANCGYGVYQVPGKGFAHAAEYSQHPLATLKRYCEVPNSSLPDVRRDYVASLAQENFLFVRQEK
jgi:hypothetical protein